MRTYPYLIGVSKCYSTECGLDIIYIPNSKALGAAWSDSSSDPAVAVLCPLRTLIMCMTSWGLLVWQRKVSLHSNSTHEPELVTNLKELTATVSSPAISLQAEANCLRAESLIMQPTLSLAKTKCPPAAWMTPEAILKAHIWSWED